jgi:RNA:NAD 2'-phosphotransferase (TPT1/KptA family)
MQQATALGTQAATGSTVRSKLKANTDKSAPPKWLYHMTNAAAARSIQQSQMNPDHQGRIWGAPTIDTAASRHVSPDDTAILRFKTSVGEDTLEKSTKIAWHITPK